MTTRRRWLIVAVGVLLLIATPYAVSRLPAGSSRVAPSTLLSRVLASGDVAFSGYAEAQGSLGLPDVNHFGEVAALLGGRTDLRIWWRGGLDWRTDAVSISGETDVHQDADGLWQWDYERNRATRVGFTVAPAARLPRPDDLAPGPLARRLLSQAVGAEVRRIDGRRIAGTAAAGLEYRPRDPRSTIARIDVWAVASSGLPVRVEVHPRSGDTVLSSVMLDLSSAEPGPERTAFTPPDGAQIEYDQVTDVLSAIDRFIPGEAPARLAGIGRASGSTSRLGSVGVYGRGVLVFVAIPLPADFADEIAGQVPGLRTAADGSSSLAVGPMSLRLSPPAANGSRWLLAGTVTPATLAAADRNLPSVDDFRR